MKEAAFQKKFLAEIRKDKSLVALKVMRANVVGVPDIYVQRVKAGDSGTTRGAWIELKVGYGKTTPAQRSMLARLGGLCIRRHEYDLGEPSLSVDRYWVGEDGEPKTITVCTAPAREMTPLVNHLLDLAI